MIKRLVALAACLLCLGAAVSAQTVTGTLQGTVKDPNGAVLPGATVAIRNVETGQERTLNTNEDGSYVAAFLPIGRYDVTATGQGFGSTRREGVEVLLNQNVVADFTLSPTVGETVTVTTNEEPINTTNAEIKGRLNEQEILDKPTFNQSNFLSLAETFTGFQENPTSGQNNPTSSSGSSINFNGTGTRGATFQINGVNNDDASENQNRQGASLSTIKEFQVITNNFSSEFGRGYGAVVLVQTKSGTNGLHGDVYLYHNDSALNATNNVFTPGTRKPVNRRNQYGFTSGFPFIKNRLFGFVSFDHVQNSGAGGYTRDLFLAAERNPANWFQQTPANNTPANRAFIQSVLDRFPASLTPNDPRNARTYTGQVGFDRPLKDYSGRLDWNARESDNVFVRWQYTRQVFDNEDIILGEATKQNNKQQNVGLTWTHLFSNATVGEFRYGLGLRTTLVGIKGGNDTPIIRFGGSPVSGSIIGNAGAFPINRWQTDHQFVYNLTTLFAGNHYFKAGTDVRRQRLDDVADNFSRGFYNLAAACNGVNYGTSYNALLNGCAANYQKGYGPFFLENRLREANFYAEDNWKVRPNLTFNLGVRYEYVSAPEEARGRIDYGFGADKNNVEPRVGFAWSPEFGGGFLGSLFGGPGDSSIRAGSGIYHGRLFQSVFSQSGSTVRFNPPNALFYNQSGVTTSTFNPNNLADPTGGFVFTPGPQSIRHAEAHIDPGLEMPYTQQWSLSFERQLPFRSSLRLSYTGNRGIGLIKYSLENLPLTGDVVVVNAARVVGGEPREALQLHGARRQRPAPRGHARADAAARGRPAVRGHGPAEHPDDRALPGRRAHRRARIQRPAAARQRAPPRPALHHQHLRRQRRLDLLQRPPGDVGEEVQPRPQLPDLLHLVEVHRHDLGGDQPRRGRQLRQRLEHPRQQRARLARALALRHAPPPDDLRHLPAALLQRRARPARRERAQARRPPRRLDGLRRAEARLGHALLRHQQRRLRRPQLRRLHRDAARADEPRAARR
jgi:outer membrane receptor protein involved in Fe transport